MKAMVTKSPDFPFEDYNKENYDYEVPSKEFSIPFPVIKKINEVILDHLRDLNEAKLTSKDKMQPRTDKFSVSQASYDCYRKIYYEMLFPRQAGDDKLGTFTMGDVIDTICKDAFGKIGGKPDNGCGKSYYGGKFRIQGTDDIELDDGKIIELEGCVIEVKSVSPFAWKYIVGGKDKLGNVIIGKPKIQHVRQVTLYMDMRRYTTGLILYVNKDNFNTKIFPVALDSGIIMQTVGRCAVVYNNILAGTVPAKVKGEECSYCNHTDLCKTCR